MVKPLRMLDIDIRNLIYALQGSSDEGVGGIIVQFSNIDPKVLLSDKLQMIKDITHTLQQQTTFQQERTAAQTRNKKNVR